MKEAEADRARCACASDRSQRRTTLALKRLVAELSPTYAAVALAIRKPPFPELPATVRAVWTSYSLEMRCGRDAVSTGHLRRGQAAWPRGAVVPPRR